MWRRLACGGGVVPDRRHEHIRLRAPSLARDLPLDVDDERGLWGVGRGVHLLSLPREPSVEKLDAVEDGVGLIALLAHAPYRLQIERRGVS